MLLDRLYKATQSKNDDKESIREAKEKIEDILGHINAVSFLPCITSSVMRQPAFCIYKNRGTDQLRGSHAADHHLCFRYIDSSTHLLLTSEI